jgi:hypothetical protein
MTYAAGYLGHGVRQAQNSGGVKPVNLKDFNPSQQIDNFVHIGNTLDKIFDHTFI